MQWLHQTRVGLLSASCDNDVQLIWVCPARCGAAAFKASQLCAMGEAAAGSIEGPVNGFCAGHG